MNARKYQFPVIDRVHLSRFMIYGAEYSSMYYVDTLILSGDSIN